MCYRNTQLFLILLSVQNSLAAMRNEELLAAALTEHKHCMAKISALYRSRRKLENRVTVTSTAKKLIKVSAQLFYSVIKKLPPRFCANTNQI